MPKTNEIDHSKVAESDVQANKIRFLPAILTKRKNFKYNPDDGNLRATLDVIMPGGETRIVEDIRVVNWQSDKDVPLKGAIFKVVWQQNLTDVDFNILLGPQNAEHLEAQYIGSENEFKQSIDAQQWTRDPDATTNPPKTKSLFDGTDSCILDAPTSLKQAMDMMAENTGDQTIFAPREPGNRARSSAMVINNEGVFFYLKNADEQGGEGEVPLSLTKDKVKAKKIETETANNVEPGAAGVPSTPTPTLPYTPASNVMMPQPRRLPGFEIIEWAIKLADVGKLVYDFIKAYKKAGTAELGTPPENGT